MKLKILSLSIVSILIFTIFTACSFEKNYGHKLPPDLPSSVPIIEGTIEDSRTATFEDGKGFVIGIKTPLSYEESIIFYKKAFETSEKPAKFTEATNISGAEQKVMAVEVQHETSAIFMEIISGEGSSYINIAVHLKK